MTVLSKGCDGDGIRHGAKGVWRALAMTEESATGNTVVGLWQESSRDGPWL